MRQQKGFTLLEVLGSVIILSIAVLSITFLFQQTTIFSQGSEHADQSVLITRTVMEEIKNALDTAAATVTVNGQLINLAQLRNSNPPFTLSTTLFHPSLANPDFEIDITSIVIPDADYMINNINYNLHDYFRLIHITTTNLVNQRSFELETYIEYN